MSVAHATVTQKVNHPPRNPKYRSPFIVSSNVVRKSGKRCAAKV